MAHCTKVHGDPGRNVRAGGQPSAFADVNVTETLAGFSGLRGVQTALHETPTHRAKPWCLCQLSGVWALTNRHGYWAV